MLMVLDCSSSEAPLAADINVQDTTTTLAGPGVSSFLYLLHPRSSILIPALCTTSSSSSKAPTRSFRTSSLSCLPKSNSRRTSSSSRRTSRSVEEWLLQISDMSTWPFSRIWLRAMLRNGGGITRLAFSRRKELALELLVGRELERYAWYSVNHRKWTDSEGFADFRRL